MTQISDEYAAGFFDGEGCIMIARHGPRQHKLVVTISQLAENRRVLDRFTQRWGGHVRSDTRPRPIAVWRVEHALAADFLRDVLPYLDVKKDQAQLALEFQSRKLAWHEMDRPRLTDEEIQVRAGYRERLQSMKRAA